jgi:D-glycero-alpha-D-manno-heptose-7-phosphate kinase
MILTRTPLRISLFGGGTDLPVYCSKRRGHVVTGAIDQYVYVALKQRFDGKTRVCYSRTELVSDVRALEHDRVRETLRKAKLDAVDVCTFSDVPPNGSGLGASSAVTVGLIHAIYGLRGVTCEQYELAAEAAKIEIAKCKKPIGRQDQYACAMGGVRELRFSPGNDMVEQCRVSPVAANRLSAHLLMFYLGMDRDSDAILTEQTSVSQSVEGRKRLDEMAQLADEAGKLLGHGLVDDLGEMLDRSWQLKKQMAAAISNPQINQWYRTAIEAGATGGKVCGAGGGGFLVFFVPPGRQADVIAALPTLRHIPFQWDWCGSTIVYRQA